MNQATDRDPQFMTNPLQAKDLEPHVTERAADLAAANGSLRQSQDRFHSAMESMLEGCQILDRDWRYVYINDAAERHNRRLKTDLLGKRYMDAWPGIEGTPIFALIRDCMEKQAAQRIENLFAFPDGTSGWFDLSIQPVPEGVFILSMDITERKQAEEALRASRANLEAALTSMTDAVFISDAAGRFIEFNDAFATFHRFKNKAECAKTLAEYPNFLEVFLPDGKPAPLEMWAVPRALRGETVTNAEYGLRRKDTGESWVGSYSFGPIRNQEGAIVGSVVVGRDVTERKRAEEALRRSEERLNFAMETSHIGAWELDLKNHTAHRTLIHDQIFGYETPLPSWTYEMFLEHVLPEDRTEVDRRFREAMKTQSDWNFECRIRRADGEVRWIFAAGGHEQISKGQAVRMSGIVQDITDRKKTEAEREKLEVQLRQAQKMDSVGRLAGGVAHDFNNMLGVILGHVELALGQMDPAQPLRADLEEIRKAAEHSVDLTRQLLAFARKQTIAPKVLDLNGTVEGTLKMLKRLIGEDIDLAWMPGADLGPVKMDPSQIDQILANLCVNARDAIVGVGKMTIETANHLFDEAYCADHPGVAPGEYVRLAVSDNGCGMDRETQSNIFEPFFTTKGVGEGTGLGLATVYGIVKQNFGVIEVYSEPGQGTTFKIYLPRYQGEDSPLRKDLPEEPVAYGHETILLVEDELAILNLTRKMVEQLGYTVLTAGTPNEAIRKARGHAGGIHLLLTDVVMPEMNGRDLSRTLRARNPRLKTLFMSGYTANVIAHHGVVDEKVCFIQKPFSMQELSAKIREALESGKD